MVLSLLTIAERLMSELVLYGNDTWTSPYVFSAFVTLTEKGLDFEMKTLSLEAKAHEAPAYRDASVTGRVPALKHKDFWLAESSAIDEYLEDVFAPPQYARLYPADPQERARVRMVQALVRSDFTALRQERPTSSFWEGKPVYPLSSEGLKTAQRFVRIASALLPDPNGHVASHFTIADADLSVMAMRLVANGDPVPDSLAVWAKRIWDRPSIRAWLSKTKYEA